MRAFEFWLPGGENLVISVNSSDRFEKLPDLAADIVRRKPDVIVTFATNPLEAAKKATHTIPIVMVRVAEPMRYVVSLSRPGGNITGVGNATIELAGKRLELLKEVVPGLTRSAALTHSRAAIHPRYLEMTRVAAAGLGVSLHIVEVRSAEHLPSALAEVGQARVGALLPFPDGMFNARRRDIIGFASANRLPTIYTEREWAEDGALMSYGPNYHEQWQHAAIYVAKIMNGAKPADLPIEEPRKLELVINLKTAKALGLTIPPSLLLRADQVIE